MPDLPKITRDARLLAPTRPNVTARAVVLCGTALASLGVMTAPSSHATTPSATTVRIAAPSTTPGMTPLVLTPPHSAVLLLAQHRSHASHASHYSSSTGSSSSTSSTKGTASTKPTDATSAEKPAAAEPHADAEHAVLTVTSLPSLSEIEIDGKYMGSTRSLLRLTPGSHQITIKKEGYAPWTRTIEVAANTDLAVYADLHVIAPAPSAKKAPTTKK